MSGDVVKCSQVEVTFNLFSEVIMGRNLTLTLSFFQDLYSQFVLMSQGTYSIYKVQIVSVLYWKNG